MKFNHGLSIRLYLPKTSTVFTVFGFTILTERLINIMSKIIAGTNIAAHQKEISIIGTTIRTIGITTQSIF